MAQIGEGLRMLQALDNLPEFDTRKVMTLCGECRLMSCMDCTKELDGRLLCLKCRDAKVQKQLQMMLDQAIAPEMKARIRIGVPAIAYRDADYFFMEASNARSK